MCNPGYFNNKDTQSSCSTLCETGKYSGKGAIQCQKCPGGYKGTKSGASSMEDGKFNFSIIRLNPTLIIYSNTIYEN